MPATRRAEHNSRSGPCVGHGQHAWADVLANKVLVIKVAAIYGLSTGAVAVLKVTALRHEARNDTVEDGPLVMKRLAAVLASTLLA